MGLSKKEFVPEMKLIPGGYFFMGSDDADNEKQVHRVWVDSFMLGKFPVTNRQYGIFAGETGAPEPPLWHQPMFSHPDKPVVGISWYDAVSYCQWLSECTGQEFRLPSEAEWERAARGGLERKRYPWGDEPPWERAYPGYDVETGGPQPVGLNEPNGFGLYDMSEGVHEWCNDFYEPGYYRHSPERNPQGPPSGKRRASRGGSWRHRIKFSRCAARSSLPPSFQYADYGFRVAMTLSGSSSTMSTPTREPASRRR